MAKIVITIEDNPDGSVKMESTPNAATITKMVKAGQPTTAAHGFTIFLFNKALDYRNGANKPRKKSSLWMPGAN